MAAIAPVSSRFAGFFDKSILWETLTQADTATGVAASGKGAVMVTGTFGGATVVFQASNDNVTWWNLKDTSGTAISLTAAGGADFETNARYIRPSATGGTGQDIDITVITRK